MTLVVAAATLALKPLAMMVAVPRFSLAEVAVQAPPRIAVTDALAAMVTTSSVPPLPRSVLVSVLVTVKVSRPAPPVRVLEPRPPMRVSAPLPPIRVSLSDDPVRVTAVALPALFSVKP